MMDYTDVFQQYRSNLPLMAPLSPFIDKSTPVHMRRSTAFVSIHEESLHSSPPRESYPLIVQIILIYSPYEIHTLSRDGKSKSWRVVPGRRFQLGVFRTRIFLTFIESWMSGQLNAWLPCFAFHCFRLTSILFLVVLTILSSFHFCWEPCLHRLAVIFFHLVVFSACLGCLTYCRRSFGDDHATARAYIICVP
jgi:hypothetical protein